MATCFVAQPIHPDGIKMLQAHGVTVRFASRLGADVIIEEVGDAEAVITRDLGFSEAAMRRAPRLKIVSFHSAGTNNIDMEAARRHGIMVTNAPGMNSRSAAEMTIALILCAARQICEANDAVRHQNWDWRYKGTGIELYQKTLGLIGFGTIARMVAHIAKNGLGMKVQAWSPHVPSDIFEAAGVEKNDDIDDLLQTSQVISLHRPWKTGEAPTLTEERLQRLQENTIIINTSRGAVIDPKALLTGLKKGFPARAALDVMIHEPPLAEDPLFSAPNIIFTPHAGASTTEALSRTSCMCARQVIDVLNGKKPPHIVSAQ